MSLCVSLFFKHVGRLKCLLEVFTMQWRSDLSKSLTQWESSVAKGLDTVDGNCAMHIEGREGLA